MGRVARFRIPLDGSAMGELETVLDPDEHGRGVELSTINPAYVGKEYRYLYACTRAGHAISSTRSPRWTWWRKRPGAGTRRARCHRSPSSWPGREQPMKMMVSLILPPFQTIRHFVMSFRHDNAENKHRTLMTIGVLSLHLLWKETRFSHIT